VGLDHEVSATQAYLTVVTNERRRIMSMLYSEMGFSKAQLARETGKSVQRISQILNGTAH
jgi:transcriptional regulator with XRE-family HTH domain